MSKRFLSLALALALLLSVGTFAVSADTGFRDNSQIRHQEAVSTLVEAGIIDGLPDGSFGPTQTLTRAQACKILTVILGGSAKARSTFSDVDPNHWAIGYITYCSNNDIVSGDGVRFYPEGELTGSAWSKMLLAALGYDADATGMSGSEWEDGVSALASAEDLYRGLGGSFDPSRPVSRDDACQIAYNCLYDGETPPPANPSDALRTLSYAFGNNSETYGYPTPYQIPIERFRLIYGNTEKAEQMKARFGNWGGNCYGMSATAGILFQPGNGISPSDFRTGASAARELSVGDRCNIWNLTLREWIEALHITQLDDGPSQVKAQNKGNIAALCAAVEQFQRTGRDPVILSVRGTNKGKSSGHAILGTGVETSGGQTRVKVYDVNYPLEERYITLTGSNGNYTGWSYEMWPGLVWNERDANGMISFTPYSVFYQSWQNRKGDLVSDNLCFLTVSDDAEIRDESGALVARVENGEVISSRKDVFPAENIGLTLYGSPEETSEATLWLPGNCYTVQRSGRSYGDFTATFTQVNQSVSVQTDAPYVTLAVDDETETRLADLTGNEGYSYELTIRSSIPGAEEEITAEGTVTDGDMVVGRDQGEMVATGAETVYVNGVPASTGSGSGAASGKDVNDYPVLLTTYNTAAVQNGTTRELVDGYPMKGMPFSPSNGNFRIDAITTYHWNYGRGQTPGTISIYEYDSSADSRTNTNGRLVGTWQAIGRSGSGAENVNWDVFPDIILTPGYYCIFDSDPDTWSSNAESEYLYPEFPSFS
ncbi:MAG: S-layer homology domain-containing protein [Oscillospiraceae bacterium]|nr:S-layer homology domain-containing protein [Oscillospiraceae bacterium]